jgi:hypothetical protein
MRVKHAPLGSQTVVRVPVSASEIALCLGFAGLHMRVDLAQAGVVIGKKKSNAIRLTD